jgi:hypothetical protein
MGYIREKVFKKRAPYARQDCEFVHEGFDHGGRIFSLASPACADPQRKQAFTFA